MVRNKKKKFHLKIKNKPLLMNTGIMIIGFLMIFFTLNSSVFFGIYNYEVGSVVKEDIYLQKDIVDSIATEKLRETKTAEIDPVMTIDFSKQVETKKTLNEFFSRLLEIKNTYSNDTDLMKKVYAGIEKKNEYGLSESELMNLITLSEDKIHLLQNYAVDITVENMTGGLSAEEKTVALENINNYISLQTDTNDFDKTFLSKLISSVLTVNKFVDEKKTLDKINIEMAKIDDITYTKGTLLASKGDIITENRYELLKSGGMLVESTQDQWFMVFGLILLLSMIWVILHLYLYFYEKQILASTKKYAILMSLFLVAFLSSRFFYDISPFSIPIPAFAMLAGIMLTPTVAAYFAIMLVILISMWTGLTASMMIAYLFTILICRALVKNIKVRSQVVGIGLYVSLILILYTITQSLIYKTELVNLPFNLIFSVGNGMLSSVITIGIMPFFESFFGILTPFKLLELSNPNRPLLKRLLIEAPGTYHHSILVGNLAETAAHDIGANSLLTRVSSFYHDVGKLERPYYFKENQIGHDNPHDRLPPQISANTIKNHVNFGVELAEESRLPKEIIDIIKAHHGTSLIKYFYHREKINNEDVDISKFLYPGPKPESKEAVILMLADSIEAAVRSVEEPNRESITALIEKIISQKIIENQLSSADLTFKELEVIKSSFLSVLSGIFHERIAYPEINLTQISKSTFDENVQSNKE